jgi:hypothetical protein
VLNDLLGPLIEQRYCGDKIEKIRIPKEKPLQVMGIQYAWLYKGKYGV